jgi:hypothetical protein
MSRSIPLSLVLTLAACGTAGSGEPGTPTSSFADIVESQINEAPADEDAGTYRRTLGMTVTPLIPGDQVTFTVTGANPGETIHVARSLAGEGAGPCLGTASAACLGILNPSIQGTVNADANGVATLTQTLPLFLTIGTNVAFQAVAPRGASGVLWVNSPPVATTIADAPLHTGNMIYGDLVITEVMQNPAAVPDTDGEWFEILNVSGLDANLSGLELTDFTQDSFTISGNLFLNAGGRVVLARNADPAVNGGLAPDYTYGNAMSLGNAIDELHIVSQSGIVDSVAWDDGVSFPDPVGASMELDGLYNDADANNAGVNWAEATTPYGAGDLGTPDQAGPTSCDPTTEVVYDGRCYYLDGSGGTCEPGYELAPQSVLNTISGDFAGLDYKNAISGNCCIWHADIDVELQDWGMDANCNSAGPFLNGPVPGGSGCNNSNNRNIDQLTLCQSL